MILQALLLAFLTLVTWVVFYNFYWKRRNLPPGPVPWPIIGNLHEQMSEQPIYHKFLEWRRRYGPVFTFWMGEKAQVMVTDYDLIMDVFVRNSADATSGRYAFPVFTDQFRGGRFGVIEVDGDFWKEQRRFSLHVLRNFGVGRNIMEEKILDEVVALCRNLEQEPQGAVVDIIGHIETCIGSIINQLLLGYRFDGDKLDEFKRLKTLMSAHMRNVTNPFTTLALLFPVTQNLPFCKQHYKQAHFCLTELFGFFDRQIEEHEREINLESEEEPTDYVEAFLREMHRHNDTASNYSRIQLRNVLFDLWIAGMETTSNTCQFAVNYILNHSEAYGKVCAELDRVVGGDRLVTLKDKPSLPYLQATINEVQRMANLLAVNLMHETTEPINVAGFQLPAGTCVIPMISCVLADEKIFPEPHRFKPERFLDGEGQLKKVEELVPFSIGKRQCLGESLARMELFLVLANLFHHFHLKPEHPNKPPSMQKRNGITVQIEPFKIRLEKRVFI